MNEFYDILNLGAEGSKVLASKYQKQELARLIVELNKIEEKNTKALENLLMSDKYEALSVEIDIALQNGENLLKLKKMIGGAIEIQKSESIQKNNLFLVPQNKLNITIPSSIVIQKQDLKSIHEEIDLGTNLKTDKQFLYNCKQENVEVTNEIYFDMEILFEPLASIPLRIQNKSHPLDQEISFEVNFSF